MLLSQKELQFIHHTAINASLQAGRIIRAKVNEKHTVYLKDEEDNQQEVGSSLASQVVTEVDHLAQEAILKGLNPVAKAFDFGILAEESEDDKSRFEKEYFWCIDPLDGTLPFTEKKPGYAVSISLVHRSGIPKVGVIYDPYMHHIYSCYKEGGVYKDGLKWNPNKGQQKNDNKVFTLVGDRSFFVQPNYDEIYNDILNMAQQLGYQNVELIDKGGACMNAIWTLENAPACYFKFPKKKRGGGSLWDYAASSCIYSELGYPVSDGYGNPLNLNNAQSTFMNEFGVCFSSSKAISARVLQIIRKRS